MRIGIVSEYVRPWPGGISEHVHHEALELRRRGHDVTVLSGPSGSGEVFDAGVARLPWALEFVSNGARARVSLGPQLLALRAFLTAHRFDVLHVHAPLDPLLSVASVLCATCPVVGTFHASFAPGPLWELLFRGLGPITHRACARLSDKIAVSDEAERSIAHYFPGRYRRLPNGVDLTRFSPRVATAREAEPKGACLLFVGRPDPRKGLSLLLAAFAQLRRQQRALRLCLAGVSERELARLTRAHDGVSALGYVDPSDLPDLYAQATLVCAPSLAGESQGVVLLEAMASGKLVVCFDIPGYRELATHRETAWIVNERSAQALAHGIDAALADDALRAAARTLGPAYAANYAWPAIAARIEAVLLGAARVSGPSARSRADAHA